MTSGAVFCKQGFIVMCPFYDPEAGWCVWAVWIGPVGDVQLELRRANQVPLGAMAHERRMHGPRGATRLGPECPWRPGAVVDLVGNMWIGYAECWACDDTDFVLDLLVLIPTEVCLCVCACVCVCVCARA